jgi:hypothetical protein
MTRTSYPLSAMMLVTLCAAEAITACAASNWTLQVPSSFTFPTRFSQTAVYDPGTNNMIVFGGFDVVAWIGRHSGLDPIETTWHAAGSPLFSHCCL